MQTSDLEKFRKGTSTTTVASNFVYHAMDVSRRQRHALTPCVEAESSSLHVSVLLVVNATMLLLLNAHEAVVAHALLAIGQCLSVCLSVTCRYLYLRG